MCDNSRWRPVLRYYDRTLTPPAWVREEGIDPYALGVPQVKGGWTAASATDESWAAQHAVAMARLRDELRGLLAAERVRTGQEALLSGVERKVETLLEHEPPTLLRIMRAVGELRARHPLIADELPNGQRPLLALALMVHGRLDAVRS
jgi:hypothetical protein